MSIGLLKEANPASKIAFWHLPKKCEFGITAKMQFFYLIDSLGEFGITAN